MTHSPLESASAPDPIPAQRYCPACGHAVNRELWRTNSQRAAQHFVRSYRLPDRHARLRRHIESMWGQDTAAMMQCDACQLVFAHPFVGGDATFYNLAYPGTPVYPQDKWEFRRTLQALGPIDAHRAARMKVLEVGAGDGGFVDRLIEHGLDRSAITAFEYNNESLANLRAKGIVAQAASFAESRFEAVFDAIFMFQVLEHMDRLDAVFDRLRASLVADGRAYIAVPNPLRIAFNEATGSLRDMPPNHISRWQPVTFERLASRHGMTLLEHEFEATSFRSFLAQDLGYFYLEQSMLDGSMAATTYQVSPPLLGSAARYGAAGYYAIRRIPIWIGARASARRFGNALWVCLGHA